MTELLLACGGMLVAATPVVFCGLKERRRLKRLQQAKRPIAESPHRAPVQTAVPKGQLIREQRSGREVRFDCGLPMEKTQSERSSRRSKRTFDSKRSLREHKTQEEPSSRRGSRRSPRRAKSNSSGSGGSRRADEERQSRREMLLMRRQLKERLKGPQAEKTRTAEGRQKLLIEKASLKEKERRARSPRSHGSTRSKTNEEVSSRRSKRKTGQSTRSSRQSRIDRLSRAPRDVQSDDSKRTKSKLNRLARAPKNYDE